MIINFFFLLLVWGVVEDGLYDAEPHPETMKKKMPTDATLRSDSATKHELHKLLRFFFNLCQSV